MIAGVLRSSADTLEIYAISLRPEIIVWFVPSLEP
jgi:hypothetical protein